MQRTTLPLILLTLLFCVLCFDQSQAQVDSLYQRAEKLSEAKYNKQQEINREKQKVKLLQVKLEEAENKSQKLEDEKDFYSKEMKKYQDSLFMWKKLGTRYGDKVLEYDLLINRTKKLLDELNRELATMDDEEALGGANGNDISEEIEQRIRIHRLNIMKLQSEVSDMERKIDEYEEEMEKKNIQIGRLEDEAKDRIFTGAQEIHFEDTPYQYGEPIMFFGFKPETLKPADTDKEFENKKQRLIRLAKVVLKYDKDAKIRITGQSYFKGMSSARVRRENMLSRGRADMIRGIIDALGTGLTEEHFSSIKDKDGRPGVSISIVKK